jgi:hypothetical protein
MRKVFCAIFLLLSLSCRKDNVHYDPPYNPEILIYDSVFTTTVDDRGYFYFSPRRSAGTNWISPYDYYNGEWYYRIEILDCPSDTSFVVNLCIWSDVEGNWVSWKESCCGFVEIKGKGIYTATSVPSEWWKLGEPVDFSRVDDFFSMGLALWCDDLHAMSDWDAADAGCWAGRDYVLPLTLDLLL